MTGADIALIITASGGVILALATAVGAIGVLIPILRRTKETKVIALDTKTLAAKSVHLANQALTDVRNYNIALTEFIRAANLPVPVDQSKGFVSPQADPPVISGNTIALEQPRNGTIGHSTLAPEREAGQ